MGSKRSGVVNRVNHPPCQFPEALLWLGVLQDLYGLELRKGSSENNARTLYISNSTIALGFCS